MKLTIHRGTHEIGGSCVELCSESGDRIILDLGLPLVNPDKTPFEWNDFKELPVDQLIANKILPNIAGLYRDGDEPVSAIILSHAHLDHYGLLRFVKPETPIFMSAGTKALAEVSNAFLDTKIPMSSTKTFEMWQQFKVGDFTITPYLMDHSAPDAAAFLIEVDGKRIFYTGDFRGHGRKAVVLDRLTKNPPGNIDVLLMEGSMLGRNEGLYPDEASVEEAIVASHKSSATTNFVFASSQNLDRLVSIYRAAKRCHKTLVIDLYTAFVLDKLGGLSSSIPQFDWDGVRVLYLYNHAQKLADLDRNLLYKYKSHKIEQEEIIAAGDMVVLAKDNRYYRSLIQKCGQGTAIYSMWHGYLEKTNLPAFLREHCIDLVEIHTSGHAYVDDLKALAKALHPKTLMPIHTFFPEKYQELFSNVVQLKDGETMDLDAIKTEETRCRGLSTSFLNQFKSPDGLYSPLVDLVRSNKDLHMEFRGRLQDSTKPEKSPSDEAIGIYFKGNNILGLHANQKVEIDQAFQSDLDIPKNLCNPDDVQKYLKAVPELMCRVASRGKSSMEIEYEQMIIRANNKEARNNSEYIILANQYGIGKDRWDLLAVKWPRLSRGGKNPVGRLALIEVKYALNTDIQKAHEQLARYYDYISRNLDSLCTEMELILSQKLALGLIERDDRQIAQLQKLKLSRNITEIEMILYLVDYNPNSIWKTKMMKKADLLPFKDQIRIISGGLAIWDQSSKTIEEEMATVRQHGLGQDL